MTAPACAFEAGVLHDHGAPQCHEASRRAGAVDALREAADEVRGADPVGNQTFSATQVVAYLNHRADLIARGKSVTS